MWRLLSVFSALASLFPISFAAPRSTYACMCAAIHTLGSISLPFSSVRADSLGRSHTGPQTIYRHSVAVTYAAKATKTPPTTTHSDTQSIRHMLASAHCYRQNCVLFLFLCSLLPVLYSVRLCGIISSSKNFRCVQLVANICVRWIRRTHTAGHPDRISNNFCFVFGVRVGSAFEIATRAQTQKCV